MSSLNQTRDRLQAELSRLHTQWQLTSDRWRDAVHHRFEREFWQEYDRAVLPTLREMDRLAEVISQARREVK